MASWDVFHADRLELERASAPARFASAWRSGDLRDDDLVRPAGTTVAWARLSDIPELFEITSTRAGADSDTSSS